MSDEKSQIEELKRSPLAFIKMLLAKRMKPVDLETRYKIERPEGVKDWFAEAYAKAHQESGWTLTFYPWVSTSLGDAKATLQFIDEPQEGE